MSEESRPAGTEAADATSDCEVTSRQLVLAAQPVNARLVRAAFWPKLRRLAASAPFAEDALALFYCAFDRETPAAAKGLLVAALAYFVIPRRYRPRQFAGLGFTDDAAVIAMALAAAGRAILPKHRAAARAALAKLAGEPT